MKIAFLNSGFPPSKGGVSTYSYNWAVNTSQNPQVEKVQVFAFGNSKPRSEKVNPKLTINAFISRNFFFVGFALLPIFLTHLKFDYFHATNLFPVGFWTVFWSKVFRKKSVVTFHGTDACSSLGSSKTKKLKKWTIEHAHKAIAVSQFTKSKACELLKINRDDITVIYAGTPQLPKNNSGTQGIKDKYKINDDSFVILSVCQLVKRKGLDYLIQAIKQTDQNVKLLIVGKGKELANLQALIDKLGLTDRVFLVGKASHVLPYYSIAKIFVLNSYYLEGDNDFEGLGLVLLEAQSLGIPVIGANSGGIPEAIHDGFSGYIIPTQDPDTLAHKINQFKNDHNLYQKFSQGAKNFVQEKFDPQKNIEKYINYLQA